MSPKMEAPPILKIRPVREGHIRLFVYGVLKDGHHMYEAIFVTEGFIQGFVLHDRGVAFVSKTERPLDRVYGQIWDVPEQQVKDRIDRMEAMYDRTPHTDIRLGPFEIYLDRHPVARYGNGKIVKCWNRRGFKPRGTMVPGQISPAKPSRW